VNTCPCGRPAGSFTLCRVCVRTLTGLLVEVPALAADLDVTLTRQDRVSEAVGRSGGDERPLPFSVVASDAARLLRATVCAWALELGLVTTSTVLASRFLAANVADLRGRADGPVLLDELDHVTGLARRAVDRHVPLLWFGVCGLPAFDGTGGPPDVCHADLYGEADAAAVVCPRCRSEHSAQVRRRAVLDVAVDRELPAADLVRLSRAYGLPTTKGVVDGLIRRGRLTATSTTPDGRPAYRVGSLLDLLTERMSA
jgi:hypothetical protein